METEEIRQARLVAENGVSWIYNHYIVACLKDIKKRCVGDKESFYAELNRENPFDFRAMENIIKNEGLAVMEGHVLTSDGYNAIKEGYELFVLAPKFQTIPTYSDIV